MYITKSRKYHKQADGSYTAYDYFRLTRKRYDASGDLRGCPTQGVAIPKQAV